jgi:hypothetical protein
MKKKHNLSIKNTDLLPLYFYRHIVGDELAIYIVNKTGPFEQQL